MSGSILRDKLLFDWLRALGEVTRQNCPLKTAKYGQLTLPERTVRVDPCHSSGSSCLKDGYPIDSDLSAGLRYPAVEQLGQVIFYDSLQDGVCLREKGDLVYSVIQ